MLALGDNANLEVDRTAYPVDRAASCREGYRVVVGGPRASHAEERTEADTEEPGHQAGEQELRHSY
jgi:hypothetical protein